VAERVIFARMTPENNVQVVQTVESAGMVCAMVGDGSNDATAIRAATVGIGVVAGGSDPAHLLLGGNAGEVLFAITGSAITGTSPLNTRQLLLVNMMTDALPAAALAVSEPHGPLDPGLRGPDQPALWRAVAIRGVTTAAAASAAWAMASVTGRPQRASSLAAMGTLISIPVVSQLLGCTPLGPVAWVQGLRSAAAATIAIAALNRVSEGWGTSHTPPPQPDAPLPTDEPSDQDGEYPPPQSATAAHRVPVTAPSAPKRSRKPADRPRGRSSSTYVRR